MSLIRKGRATPLLMIVCNFTPVPRLNYRIGAPRGGFWQEVLNSDSAQYGGGNIGNFGGVEAVPIPLHGRPYSVTLAIPPLSVLFFKN